MSFFVGYHGNTVFTKFRKPVIIFNKESVVLRRILELYNSGEDTN